MIFERLRPPSALHPSGLGRQVPPFLERLVEHNGGHLKAPPKDQIGRTQSYAPTFSKHLSNAPSGQSTNAEFQIVHKERPTSIGHRARRTYTSTTSHLPAAGLLPTQSYARRHQRAAGRAARSSDLSGAARRASSRLPPLGEVRLFDFKNFDTQALAMARGHKEHEARLASRPTDWSMASRGGIRGRGIHRAEDLLLRSDAVCVLLWGCIVYWAWLRGGMCV